MKLDYIRNIDCLIGMKEIPSESIDLVVTDCPYQLSVEEAAPIRNANNRPEYSKNANRANISALVVYLMIRFKM